MHVLSHTTLLSVATSTVNRLFNILITRANINNISSRLLIRASMNINVNVVHTIRRSLHTLTVTRHVLSNRLTKRHNTANRHSLRRVTQHRLTATLTRLSIHTVLTRHIPKAILITLCPRPLTRKGSSYPITHHSHRSIVPV